MSSNPVYFRRLSYAVPLLLTTGLLLGDMLPGRLTFAHIIFPLLTLTSVYYWSVFRPQLMPYAALFLLGILQDILWGTPLGMSSCIFVIIRGWTVQSISSALTHTYTFMRVWQRFALLLAGISLWQWTILSLWHNEMQPWWLTCVQWLLTVLVYPVCHNLYTRIYAHVASPADASHARLL